MDLDFINPLEGLFARLRHGRMFRLSYERDCGYSGAQVEKMLRRYHIPVFGREVDRSDEIAVLVKWKQARFAEYILCRAGIPLTYSLIEPSNAVTYNGRMPKPWGKPKGAHSVIARIVDVLCWLVE